MTRRSAPESAYGLPWLLLFVLLATVYGCAGGPTMSSSPASQAHNASVAEHQGCRLTVRVHEVTPVKLVLAYRFDNRSGRNAYLFNLLADRIATGGVYQIDPNRVTVEIEADRATIGKKIVEVPPMTLVERREIPSVTKVTSGASFEEKLEIPLPLTVTTPYVEPYAVRTPPVGYPVDFELGFFLGANTTEQLARTAKSNLGPVMRFDPFPIESQQLLRVHSIAVGVPTVPPPKGN